MPKDNRPWRERPDSELIDMMGVAKAQIDLLNEKRAELQAELLHRGFDRGSGEFFQGYKVPGHIRWNLDRKKLEADHGEEFLRPYLKISNVAACIKVEARDDKASAMVVETLKEPVDA